MPIVFIHGVAVRDAVAWPRIKAFLRRYIGPVIANDPEAVAVFRVDWGKLGVTFAWEGASRPRSPLLRQGSAPGWTTAERVIAAASCPGVFEGLPQTASVSSSSGDLIAAGADSRESGEAPLVRLKDMNKDELSDLAAAVLQQLLADPGEQAVAAAVADGVARDPQTSVLLAACNNMEHEATLFQQRIAEALQRDTASAPGLTPMGGLGEKLIRFKDSVIEALDRGSRFPGLVFGRTMAEFRGPLNDGVTLFLGDVFTYLSQRTHDNPQGQQPGGQSGKSPGPIPQEALNVLAEAKENQSARAGEPLILLTHSMGGQIAYDLVTYFLPNLPDGHASKVRIDFWCAAASQVGLFEEMKQFLVSSQAYSLKKGVRTPRPDRCFLGSWWNVWDHNDFISFTADRVFEGVDDESFSTGYSLIRAHGGYLERPSFYRRFAQRVEAAKKVKWLQPAPLGTPGHGASTS